MIRIGISGWSYPQWRGGFYPRSLPLRDRLAFASRHFATIEINTTFYGRQPAARYDHWHDATSAEFLFAVKGPREVTHHRRLADVDGPIAAFLESGVLRLREKLGPILWQLPPGLPFDASLVERFVTSLPRAAPGAKLRLRHAVEVRHRSFDTPRFLDLLCRHEIALVFADGAAAPRFNEPTSDLIYIRLHGTGGRYTGGYHAAALDAWASQITRWAAEGSEREILVYFNNTMKGNAPFDAQALMERIDGALRPQMASS